MPGISHRKLYGALRRVRAGRGIHGVYCTNPEYFERKYFFRDRFYDSKNEGIYYFSSIRKGTGNEGGHRSIENSSNKIHDSKYLNKRYRCIFLLGR